MPSNERIVFANAKFSEKNVRFIYCKYFHQDDGSESWKFIAGLGWLIITQQK